MCINTYESRRHYLNYYKIYILNQHINFSVTLEWQRHFQMVSHKNYNPNANEDFVMFLTSNLITCFIDGFIFGMKSQSIASLLIGSAHTYWTLDLFITQYEIYRQTAFKNAWAMFSLKLDGVDNRFRSGSVNLKKTLGGCPSPYLPPLQVRRGGTFNLHPSQEEQAMSLSRVVGCSSPHYELFWSICLCL